MCHEGWYYSPKNSWYAVITLLCFNIVTILIILQSYYHLKYIFQKKHKSIPEFILLLLRNLLSTYHVMIGRYYSRNSFDYSYKRAGGPDKSQWRARALRELPEVEHLMQQMYLYYVLFNIYFFLFSIFAARLHYIASRKKTVFCRRRERYQASRRERSERHSHSDANSQSRRASRSERSDVSGISKSNRSTLAKCRETLRANVISNRPKRD